MEAPADGRGVLPGAEPREGRRALRDGVILVSRAAVLALLIYTFIFQVSEVDGLSMRPSFEHRDRLLIDKVTFLFREPRAGDVVVFEMMRKDEQGRHGLRDIVKRILAGPESRVVVKEGCLGGVQKYLIRVNGRRVDEDWLPLEQRLSEGEEAAGFCLEEEYFVPPGFFFVLGDNRAESADSRRHRRESVGLVARRQVIGRVRARLYPLDRLGWF